MAQDILVNGLIHGSIYALLAIGFSLIFGVARIVNIAHTAFYMIAAYSIHFLFQNLGIPMVLAMLLSVILVTLLGLAFYRLVISPIREHESAVLIATIALAMVLQEVILILFKGHYRGTPPLIPGFSVIAGIKIINQQLLTFGVVLVVLAGVWAMLKKTRLGLAIRTTAQDRETANLMGMNVERVAMITMGLSVMLAAIAGATVVPLFVLDPFMWLSPLIMTMAIVVLGGLGSIKGSFLGAYILGFAEVLVVFLVPGGAFLKGSVALSVMIIVLLIRPEGLYGVSFEEER